MSEKEENEMADETVPVTKLGRSLMYGIDVLCSVSIRNLAIRPGTQSLDLVPN